MFYESLFMMMKTEAFRQGYELAYSRNSDTTGVTNPYPRQTPDWYRWSRGWNHAPHGLAKEEVSWPQP